MKKYISVQNWQCVMCGKLNPPSTDVCQHCGLKKEVEVKSDSTR